MKNINKEELDKLIAWKEPTSVTLVIDTEITGDYQKNSIRWKNACQQAKNSLEEDGKDTEILDPAFDLIEDTDFWAHQSSGLMGLYAENFSNTIHLRNKPSKVVAISDRFYLLPLFKQVLNDERIFILALSQNAVNFYEAVPSGIYPVKISDCVPANMDDALKLDIDSDQIQHHTAGGDAIFHGNNAHSDKENVRLRQFFRAVDEGLLSFIHDEKVPLVLAAVEHYHSIYKEITKYGHFSDHMIVGNAESLDPAELRTQVEPVFKDIKTKEKTKFLDEYNAKIGANLTFDSLDDLHESVQHGNVKSIAISNDTISESSQERRLQIENLLRLSMEQGGDIIFVEGDSEVSTLKGIQRFAMNSEAVNK